MATNLQALKSDATPPAKKPKTIFDLLTETKTRTAISSVAGKYMTPERFLRLAVNAIKKTPKLLECEPQSVLGSFMASAALGLEPNTVLQQAFLIPYGVRGKLPGTNDWGITHYDCQFQIGYRGFITLAHRSPHIITLEAEAIHDGDYFKHRKGSDSFLEYEKALTERGALIGAFAFSRLEDGGEAATILPLDEIHKIRGRSETYLSLLRGVDGADNDWKKKKAEEKLAGTPWVLWEDDMAAKSAIKKHAKQLPMNPGDPMAAAVSLDADRDDGKTIDMADLVDPDKMREVLEDGDVPPESGQAPAALTNEQGGETLEMPTQREREKVDVGHFNAQQRETAKATATDVTATTKGAAPITATEDLERQINSEGNPDALDLLADQIRSLPAADQPRMNKLYRSRRAALSAASQPAAQASFSME